MGFGGISLNIFLTNEEIFHFSALLCLFNCYLYMSKKWFNYMVSTSQKLVLCFYCVSVGRESTQNVAGKHLAVSGRPLKLDGVTKFLMQKKF